MIIAGLSYFKERGRNYLRAMTDRKLHYTRAVALLRLTALLALNRSNVMEGIRNE